MAETMCRLKVNSLHCLNLFILRVNQGAVGSPLAVTALKYVIRPVFPDVMSYLRTKRLR